MLTLINMAKQSALILTGVSIGAAIWKARSAATPPPDGRPLKESVNDLEARLAALENVENRHTAVEGNLSGDSAHACCRCLTGIDRGYFTTRYDDRLAKSNRVGDHEVKSGNTTQS